MRRRSIPYLKLFSWLPLTLGLGCTGAFDGTFVVDELAILGVQLTPAEIVYDLDQLRTTPLTEIPLPNQLNARVLAANPEALGGRTAIESYHWAIGDPPLEGTPVLVTTVPELRLQGDAVGPALEILGGGDGVLDPAELADILAEGPLQVPLVVTAMAGLQSATAVKMLTVRGTDDGVVTPNENPTAEGLELVDHAEWNETQLLDWGDRPIPVELPPGDRIMITVDPEDDAKDGDTASTMYTTAGSIMWSSGSMRSWWFDVPEDHDFDTFHVHIVLRDQEGAQSWITLVQFTTPEGAP